MSWKVKDTNLNLFFNSVDVVSMNAIIRITPGELYCRAMSSDKTIYGVSTFKYNVEGSGVTPLPIRRITSVVDSSDTTLEYMNQILKITKGKSKFKIVELAPQVVKEPNVLTVGLTESILGIKSKDLVDALKNIGDFYRDDTILPAVRFIMGKNQLLLQDIERNVEVEIDNLATTVPKVGSNPEVLVNYDLVYPLITVLKSLPSDINIELESINKPLKLHSHSDNHDTIYYIAPRVIE